jgi:hypothetical protein
VAKYEDNTTKKSYDPHTSLRTATATPPGLKQYLYFFFQKKKKKKSRAKNKTNNLSKMKSLF